MSSERLAGLKLLSDSIQHADDGLSKKDKALMIFKTYCQALGLEIIDSEFKKKFKSKPAYKLLNADGMTSGFVCKETFAVLDDTRISYFDRNVMMAIGCLYQEIEKPLLTITNSDPDVEESYIKTMTRILLVLGVPIENIQVVGRIHEGYKVDIAQLDGVEYTPKKYINWKLWFTLIAVGGIGLLLLSL